MNLQIMSDLHLEFYRDSGAHFLRELVPKAETLVLAGDITSAFRLEHVFAVLAEKFKRILYVPGNHEFYGASLQTGWKIIREIVSKFPNVYALDNEMVTLDEICFFGGTGWFPDHTSNPLAANAERYMSDFAEIINAKPTIYESHKAFSTAVAGAGPQVVISHHLPTSASVAPRFAMSALNHFFVSDFDVVGIGAKLWIHGHTHDRIDKKIGETRIVCNPRGYPRERESFDHAVVCTV